MLTIDQKWIESPEYLTAKAEWEQKAFHSYYPYEFRDSDEFRAARLSFRKRINCSWGEAC